MNSLAHIDLAMNADRHIRPSKRVRGRDYNHCCAYPSGYEQACSYPSCPRAPTRPATDSSGHRLVRPRHLHSAPAPVSPVGDVEKTPSALWNAFGREHRRADGGGGGASTILAKPTSRSLRPASVDSRARFQTQRWDGRPVSSRSSRAISGALLLARTRGPAGPFRPRLCSTARAGHRAAQQPSLVDRDVGSGDGFSPLQLAGELGAPLDALRGGRVVVGER